jgi:hypothetical protein
MVSDDQLVLIGPGSEWFWSMLQLIVVAVSLLGLYGQVRLQTSASAIAQAETLSGRWASERMNRSQLAVLLFLRDRKDWANVPRQPSNVVGNFWEEVGFLVRKGHIRRDIVNAYLGSIVSLWWVFLGPYARELRESQGDPAIYEHFEWLAGTMAEIDRKAGLTVTVDEAGLAQKIQYSIQVLHEAIRAEEELRVPSMVPQHSRDLPESAPSGDIHPR